MLLLLLCRSVAESVYRGACRHLQLWLRGAPQLLSQRRQVSSGRYRPAAEPSLPESQVTTC